MTNCHGLPPTLQLIRAADAAGVPVIGHCLGGQLMARAFGGTVGRNPVKEIGWGEVAATDAAARLAGRGSALRGLSLARRDLQLAARRHAHSGQRPLRQPGLRSRPAPGLAMPCRDDGIHDPVVVPAVGRGRRAGFGIGADAGADGGKHRRAHCRDAQRGRPALHALDSRFETGLKVGAGNTAPDQLSRGNCRTAAENRSSISSPARWFPAAGRVWRR